MNNLRDSSLKGIIWLLLITVFTVGACDYIYAFYKSYNIENTSDEAPIGDFGDNCVKKGGKKLFSFYEDGLGFSTLALTSPIPVYWETYSFSIFKEPLRDVLTPPPLLFI